MKTTTVTIRVNSIIRKKLDDLQATGLYGIRTRDAVERLLCERLEQLAAEERRRESLNTGER